MMLALIYLFTTRWDLQMDPNDKKNILPFEQILGNADMNTFLKSATSVFLHRNLTHLLGNLSSLVVISLYYTNSEEMQPWWPVMLFFGSIVPLHMCVETFTNVPLTRVIGSSDAICALYGFAFASSLTKLQTYKFTVFEMGWSVYIFLLIIHNVVQFIVNKDSTISYAAHCFGYLSGGVLYGLYSCHSLFHSIF